MRVAILVAVLGLVACEGESDFDCSEVNQMVYDGLSEDQKAYLELKAELREAGLE